MRRIIIAAVAAAAVAAPVLATTAPANAANPPCMSRAEFRQIHQGQSLATVARIVGSRGAVSLSSPPLVVRHWKSCSNPYGSGSIGFWSGRVQSKIFI